MAVKDIDKGWGNLFKLFGQLSRQKPRIVVGMVGAKGQAMHSKSGLTNAELGAVHEFGAGVPKRSFIRSTYEKNAASYVAHIVAATGEMVDSAMGGSTGNPRDSRALKRLALRMEGDVKAAISAGIPPPNAASTIARKGSSTPLVDTGELRASIGSEIRVGDKVVA